ncbi:aldehyde dehydrogenase family protein [Rubellimicrobium roseum]|uniref:Aldehyde dehydrogenase family protein n=1 Tax=Rubellimicrobium roseum TaxID=687525 RepID=A0A5C4NGZ8_9RHOB|nr:aldehyde dehydrogenase family protein [Rubellimicrobium roseum]
MCDRQGHLPGSAWVTASSCGVAPVLPPVIERARGEVPLAGVAGRAVVDAVERNLAQWRAVGPLAHVEAPHAVATEMVCRSAEAARLTCSETGKPLAEPERGWGLAVDWFRRYAEEALRIAARIADNHARARGDLRGFPRREPPGRAGAA